MIDYLVVVLAAVLSFEQSPPPCEEEDTIESDDVFLRAEVSGPKGLEPVNSLGYLRPGDVFRIWPRRGAGPKHIGVYAPTEDGWRCLFFGSEDRFDGFRRRNHIPSNHKVTDYFKLIGVRLVVRDGWGCYLFHTEPAWA